MPDEKVILEEIFAGTRTVLLLLFIIIIQHFYFSKLETLNCVKMRA